MAALWDAVRQKGSAIVTISGRRRVGKSRLVDEFLKENRGLRVMVVPKEEKQVANDFADALSDDYRPVFNTVKDALEYFFVKSGERILFMDEFPNFLEVNHSVPIELQRLWDAYKDRTDKILIVSGSYTGMMDRIFTARKAPLFNRATFKILLEPLQEEYIWRILRESIGMQDPVEMIRTYSILGGIPYYYELMEKQGGKNADTMSLFFGLGQLREEGQDVLRQEFGSAYKRYFAILEAIGSGLVSSGEIADRIGLRQTTLSKYLISLQLDFKLIQRIVPFGQNPHRSKKGIYLIRDNLLAFWFSLVYGKLQQPSTEALNTFVGKRFELMCADFLMTYLRKRGEHIIASSRWWGSVEVEKGKHEQREIDLIVETNRCLYIGECKWSSKKAGKKELEHLRQSARALKTRKPITFVLFDRAGFDLKVEDGLLLFDPGCMVPKSDIVLTTGYEAFPDFRPGGSRFDGDSRRDPGGTP